jgi:hypothetical protein
MQRILYFLICFALLYSAVIRGESQFGYISCPSFNIGDDIQTIAAQRFLPKNSVAIDREFIGNFHSNAKVNVIVNGWYMHTKELDWYRKDVPAPEKGWPPSSSIEPLLISIHFTRKFVPFAFTDEAIAYLKAHGPVGARDYFTLWELQKRDIPSYFSGCLTLTLENPSKSQKRKNVIYAVDISPECVDFIRSKTKCSVVPLTHIISQEMSLDRQKRLEYTRDILRRYQRAKCVVTSRLHAAMPCLALETPVLLINTATDQYRFDGLRELCHNCSQDELLNGSVDFDFDHPPENPKLYLPLRENLIKIVTEWVQSKSKSDRGPVAVIE